MDEKELFKKALWFVLCREGGYVNNPKDPGGATNKGVTQNTYNAWRKSKNLAVRDVKLIEMSEINDIYYNRYWLAAGCNKMSAKFAVVCFDTAVNMGVGRVKPLLESCQYSDLETFYINRIRKYNEFAKNANQRTFLHGWLNRMFALIDFVNSL